MKHYVQEEQINNFQFSGINLWSMPRLYTTEIYTYYRDGKKHTKTILVPNPILDTRKRLG